MEREIKFRGYDAENREWRYGYYFHKTDTILCVASDEERRKNSHHLILFGGFCDWNMPRPYYQSEVDRDSIGMYTGKHDMSGTEVYEGDIISFEDTGEEGYECKEGFDFTNRAVIVWNNGRFELGKFLSNNSEVLELMNNCHEDFWNALKDCQVIGNIYENPDLLNPQNEDLAE